MISLTVLYPKTAESHFDMAYYLQKHVPLVQKRLSPLGLVQIELEEGVAGGAPDTKAGFAVIGRLYFPAIEDLQKALAAHGPELIGDIPNFTDVPPQMQVSRLLDVPAPV
ncbi:EthD family reductase [Tellurirhabdus rosea]|uniref:EthD family reductase n=1 Tax=Tellurirhabdus rosea TaxID=2674997 RepID=UPI00225161ED|nr:EthD family reductase [Tellurirhabdus rosea]